MRCVRHERFWTIVNNCVDIGTSSRTGLALFLRTRSRQQTVPDPRYERCGSRSRSLATGRSCFIGQPPLVTWSHDQSVTRHATDGILTACAAHDQETAGGIRDTVKTLVTLAFGWNLKRGTKLDSSRLIRVVTKKMI